MDMVNDGVEDLRCKYVTLIYTNYVSPDPWGQLGAGLDEQRSFVHFCLPSFLCQSPSQAGQGWGSVKSTNRQLLEGRGRQCVC